jgi:hypothetical protein
MISSRVPYHDKPARNETEAGTKVSLASESIMISNTAGSSVGIQPVLMVSVSDVIVRAEVVSYAGVTAIVW